MGNPLKTTQAWIVGLSSIGLILIVMLIIYGNLSPANVGFANATRTITVTNENLTLSSVNGNDTFVGFNSSWSGIKVTSIKNATTTGGAENYNFTVLVANATWSNTTGQITNATSLVWNITIMNYTYVYSYADDNSENIRAVQENFTAAGRNVGSQLPTVGTFIGLGLLLAVLIGIAVLAIRGFNKAQGKMGGFGSSKGKSGSFSEGDFA